MSLQQINLYQDMFREQALPVSARHAALALGALVALLILIVAGRSWQLQGLQSELAEQQQQKTALEQQANELRQQIQARRGDDQLQQELTAVNQELTNKQRILQALSGQRFGNSDGFVVHLSGLARQRIEGLWLTRLGLQQGGTRLDMEGHSLEPEYVPNYLQKLADEPVFAGTEFDVLSISRNTGQPRWMDFQLQSRIGQETAQ